MKSKLPLLLAVGVGYLLLIVALLILIAPPWNYAVLGLVLLKVGIFWGIMRQASTIGTRRRTPPQQ